GKTTTLKMINRLIEKTRGQIYVDGEEISQIDPVLLRRRIGYVIQQIGLFPHLTVAGNISIVPRLLGWPRERQKQRVDELLRLVNMDPELYRDRYPRDLSGGQQQRVGVLRALAAEPDIILMDEPFGALDPITREQLQDELKRLQAQLHKTIVFVTHDMDEALKIADRIVILRDGELVQAATPEQLLREPANDFVRNFIGPQRLVRRPEDVQVDEVMIRNPVTAEPDLGLRQGLDRMRRFRVDSLLVTDEGGRLLGIVTVEAIQRRLPGGGTLGEVMRQARATVTTGVSVREAAARMVEAGANYLPIVDGEGRLCGLITRSSLVEVMVDVLWQSGGRDAARADAVPVAPGGEAGES
ncbi:MAG TPA: ABC transporter ATP-binding protein, partial [Bacillota bacterium]